MVGGIVGLPVGKMVGCVVGDRVCLRLSVGKVVGYVVGDGVCLLVGEDVGMGVGDCVGLCVGGLCCSVGLRGASDAASSPGGSSLSLIGFSPPFSSPSASLPDPMFGNSFLHSLARRYPDTRSETGSKW